MPSGPKMLLDEHIPPDVVAGLARIRPAAEATCIRDWHEGTLRGASDDVVLTWARDDGLTLVTYDQRTIRPLLAEWAVSGRSHAGVIFVDGHTCRPDNIGGLVRALACLWDETLPEDWTNRVVYLKAVEP